MVPSNVTALLPGALFHQRYRVVRRIGEGGMGAVYEVVDDVTHGRRALKVMLPSAMEDADLLARFTLESQVIGDIESDHLVRVQDAGLDQASGIPFLVMDLLRGEDLAALLAQRGHLPPEEVVVYLSQAALGLDKTHSASIVHRDLKPANLFVTRRDDGSPCVKVLDFGIAKVASGADNHTTQTLGTPIFMAPEQFRSPRGIGPRTDIYALGHIAYTLLTGEPYWTEEKEASDGIFLLLSQIVAGPVEPPSARALRRRGVRLPVAFDAWFLRAAALRPEDRFERATAAIHALAQVFGTRAPLLSGAGFTALAQAVPLTSMPAQAGKPLDPTPRSDASEASTRASLEPAKLIGLGIGIGAIVLMIVAVVAIRLTAPSSSSAAALPSSASMVGDEPGRKSAEAPERAAVTDLDAGAPPVNVSTAAAPEVPPELDAQRKALEPRVYGGRASIGEIRQLKAICTRLGNDDCRDRAFAILQKKLSEQAP
jgi:serine/threonine protein kinase